MCFTVQLSRFFVLSLRQLVYFISSQIICQVLFQLFSNSFLMNFCLADSLFTLSCLQAFVNKFFHFFEKFIFFKKITEKEGFEPSRRVNDLLPFQGSPFGQLGYFSRLRTHNFLLNWSAFLLCFHPKRRFNYSGRRYTLSTPFFIFLH